MSDLDSLSIAINVTFLNSRNDSFTSYMAENNSTISESVVNSNKESLELVRFVVQRLLVPIVVVFGIGGNITSIGVLTHKSMKTSTNCYLTALAVFDALYLLMTFILSIKHYGDVQEHEIYLYIHIVARVLGDMCSNASVCLTVTFTIERWVAVCHPMKSHVICTPKRARIIAMIVSSYAIACTVPECFEWKIIEGHKDNKTFYITAQSELAETTSYKVGYYWFLVVGFTFVPLISLCVFNTILIRSVCRASILRRRMTYASVSQRAVDRHQGEQTRITCMLIGVAVVFIVCQFPTAALIIYYTYLAISEIIPTPNEINNLRMTGNFTNLLLAINAAINFVLYSAMSTKFRKLFMRMFCRWLPGRKVPSTLSEYSYITGMSYIKRSSAIRGTYSARNSKEDIMRSSSQNSIKKRLYLHGSESGQQSSESLHKNSTPPRSVSVPNVCCDTTL